MTSFSSVCSLWWCSHSIIQSVQSAFPRLLVIASIAATIREINKRCDAKYERAKHQREEIDVNLAMIYRYVYWIERGCAKMAQSMCHYNAVGVAIKHFFFHRLFCIEMWEAWIVIGFVLAALLVLCPAMSSGLQHRRVLGSVCSADA